MKKSAADIQIAQIAGLMVVSGAKDGGDGLAVTGIAHPWDAWVELA